MDPMIEIRWLWDRFVFIMGIQLPVTRYLYIETVPSAVNMPWICYERSFSELYLFIWNQLVLNQRLQLFVQSPQPYLLIFAWRNILVKKQINIWIPQNKSPELKGWSNGCVSYFLRYHLMMQHQPIVKRVNGTHEWAHRPYQLLSAPYHCRLYKHRRQDERQPLQSSWPVPICT